jgi:hypothetical protein
VSTRSRILMLTIVLASQTMLAGSGGSIYSLIGIGDLRHLPNVRSAGMGYAGYALTSPYSINTLSPATWGKIDRARVEASMMYEGFNSSNATTSRFLARGDVSSAILAFPLSTARGIVIAAGFTPYSKVDYNTYSSSSYVTPADTMLYSLHYTGTGGISKGQLGLSYAPTRSISLGASLNYLFGTMERATIMTPRTSAYYPGTRNEETTMNGPTYTLSVLLDSLGGASDFLQPFSFGFVATTRASLTSTHRFTYTFSDLADTSNEDTDAMTIPASFGVGIAYHPSERWILALDYTTQAWSGMEYRGKTPDGIRDAWMAGFGVERLPAREAGVPLLDRIAYRLGFAYESSYYSPNGIGINAWTITGGLGLPVSSDARLNLAIEYGVRGKTDNALIRDSIIRFSASLSISEQWFQRSDED